MKECPHGYNIYCKQCAMDVEMERQHSPMTKTEFAQLINGDMVWLAKQPRSLERDHIEILLRAATSKYYG